jgi:8-oxo-dGTP pyrophosphatase MutT (NUDIX family)
MAAGVLFCNPTGHVLLVKPTYKEGFDIPGGYVQPGESPAAAAIREVQEELGFAPTLGRILVTDWAPAPAEGDKVLFVFDGGILDDADTVRIKVDGVEISDFAFHDPDVLGEVLIERLARRVRAAADVRNTDRHVYLEHGLAQGYSAAQ